MSATMDGQWGKIVISRWLKRSRNSDFSPRLHIQLD